MPKSNVECRQLCELVERRQQLVTRGKRAQEREGRKRVQAIAIARVDKCWATLVDHVTIPDVELMKRWAEWQCGEAVTLGHNEFLQEGKVWQGLDSMTAAQFEDLKFRETGH